MGIVYLLSQTYFPKIYVYILNYYILLLLLLLYIKWKATHAYLCVCVWYFWFTKTLYPHHISGLALRCDWALLISVDKLPGRISSTSLRHPLVSQSLLISFWKYFGFQQCSFLFSLRFRFDIWVGGWVLCVCARVCCIVSGYPLF
jgi:hypothetical protein